MCSIHQKSQGEKQRECVDSGMLAAQLSILHIPVTADDGDVFLVYRARGRGFAFFFHLSLNLSPSTFVTPLLILCSGKPLDFSEKLLCRGIFGRRITWKQKNKYT